MPFTTTLEKFDSNLWNYHFPIPTPEAKAMINGDDRRVVCEINGKKKVQCALMPAGDGTWFINVNKELRTELGLVEGQSVSIHLEKDTTEYGMDMPEELRELLNQDEEGNDHFSGLTPGKQRNLIYIVKQVKSPQIRMRRALVVVTHLKLQGGGIDFKQLNEELKAANRARL
jgi:hypothetical protein